MRDNLPASELGIIIGISAKAGSYLSGDTGNPESIIACSILTIEIERHPRAQGCLIKNRLKNKEMGVAN